MDIPLSSVSQSVVQGKNELSIELNPFDEDDISCVEVRLLIPPGSISAGIKRRRLRKAASSSVAADDEDQVDDKDDAVSVLNSQLQSRIDGSSSTQDAIATFDDLMLVLPRGRYELSMHLDHFKIKGKSFDYRILYTQVYQIFMLERDDVSQHLFVLGLSPPIRQGRTSYPYIILQFDSQQQIQIELNMDAQLIEQQYKDILTPTILGQTHNVISRLFSAFTKKKVITPATFKSIHGSSFISCSLKANDGHLFLLERSFFFVKKPALYIHHQNVDSIEFSRLSGGSSAKSFDLKIQMNDAKRTVHVFSGIKQSVTHSLSTFCLISLGTQARSQACLRILAKEGSQYRRIRSAHCL